MSDPKLLFAKDAVPGTWYLNWSRHHAIKFTGAARRTDKDELEVVGIADNGDDLLPFWVAGIYPVLDAPVLVKECQELHDNEAARALRREKTKTKEVVDPETGEVKRVAVKSAKPRGEKSATTGYGVGTDGHLFGSILLEIGTDPMKKSACVDAIYERYLKARGKPRSYAKAWYNYLKSKKPEIYGKRST